MKRNDLQQVSRARLKEAGVLLRARRYAGAYYLAGYAVECALKACIAKQVSRYDFPDKTFANEAWTHSLENLIHLAGVWQDFRQEAGTNKALERNWAVVKDWKETDRYDLSITRAEARDLYSAIASRKNGVLRWIRARW